MALYSNGEVDIAGPPEESNNPAAPDVSLDFLWRTHQHIQEVIRFQDGKAIAFSAVFGAFIISLAACTTSEALPFLWKMVSLASLVTFAISIVSALITLTPRTPRASRQNILSPHNLVSDFSNPEELSSFILLQTPQDFISHLSAQLNAISRILKTKLAFIRVSSYGMLLGIVLGLPSLVAHQYFSQKASSFEQKKQSGQTPPGQVEKVSVAQFGDLLIYLPLYIAKHQGLFSEQGLDVNIISTGGDEKTFAAVAAGHADFGIADPTFAAIGSSRGASGRVLGFLVTGVPNYAVSLNQNQALSSISQLKAFRVASVPAPSTSYALTKALFEKAGEKPRIVAVAPPGLIAALKHNDADLAVLIEPWVSTIVRQGGSVALNYNDYFPRFALTGVTTSDPVLSQKPEVVKHFMKAMRNAIDVFYTDEEQTLSVARKVFPEEDPQDLRSGIRRHKEDRIYPAALAIDERAWKAAIDLRERSGDLLAATDGYRKVLVLSADGSR